MAARVQPLSVRTTAGRTPKATRGPFGARFKGYDPDSLRYVIEVYGTDGEHTVVRRYNHFIELKAQLSASALPGAGELPLVPPKSFFKKHFSPKFKLERSASLRRLLRSFMAIDPFVSTDALADFLFVRKAASRRPKQTPAWKIMSSVLEDIDGETIVEDEEEEEDEEERNVSAEAPFKKPTRRASGRLQRARGRMCQLAQ